MDSSRRPAGASDARCSRRGFDISAACAGAADATSGRMSSTLLDGFLPVYETRMVEQIYVPRSREATWRAFQEVTPRDMPLARLLGWLRTITNRSPSEELDRPLGQLIAQMGWVTLAELPGREVVVGAVGRFWRRDFGFAQVKTLEDFLAFAEPGYAKLVVSYRFEAAAGGTVLFCETRVHVTDDKAARRFRWYWRAIGLGAHLTVRSGLRA